MFYSCMYTLPNKKFLPSGNKKHQMMIFRFCTPRSIANRHFLKEETLLALILASLSP